MRRFADRAFVAAMTACGLVACALLLAIVAAILYRGLPALDWSFVADSMRESGAAGGIRYQLLGTVLLAVTALAVALPAALGIALWHAVYLPPGPGRRRVLVALYTWNGIPSIVFGIFGLLVFVRYLEWGKSWLAGGILLGMMIVPTLAVAVSERLLAVPRSTLEAAAGLGLSREQIVRSVLLPQCRGGLLSGALLGFARAAGETAPILFAAAVFSGATLPRGIVESPVVALPYHIFTLAQDAFDARAGAQLWGAAAVLLGLVAVASAVALPARLSAHEEARHG